MNERIWKLGEVVILPRKSNKVKTSGQKTYEHLTADKYVCIRESADGQRGILVKMIGRVEERDIQIIAGEPFCKDDKDGALEQTIYYSYRFPTIEELKEVLTIVRENEKLWKQLNEAGMHINPDGSFWVRELARTMLVMKKPQYYDPKTKLLGTAADAEENHRRLTLVYF